MWLRGRVRDENGFEGRRGPGAKMFGTPVNRQFESPKNRADFFLTENAVGAISEIVKLLGHNVLKRQLPSMAAELRNREVRSAPNRRHTSAAVSGSFSALSAGKAGVL